jgi:hypothetical protein
MLYNDAYRPALGIKHPWAMGDGAQALRPLLDRPQRSVGPLERTNARFHLSAAEPDGIIYRRLSYFQARFQVTDSPGMKNSTLVLARHLQAMPFQECSLLPRRDS